MVPSLLNSCFLILSPACYHQARSRRGLVSVVDVERAIAGDFASFNDTKAWGSPTGFLHASLVTPQLAAVLGE